MFLRFPARLSHSGGRGQACSVSGSRPSNRACGSPAHGSPTSFTAGIRSFPPGPEGSGCGDDPVKADQAELVGRGESNHGPAEPSTTPMPLGQEQRQPHPQVPGDLVEVPRRVAEPEVCGPAADEPVDLGHDHLDGQQQPAPVDDRRSGRGLAARVLAVVQGHPKLIELADGQAADPATLAARLDEADNTWLTRGVRLEDFLDTGQPQATDTDYYQVLDTWTRATTAHLPAAANTLFTVLAGLWTVPASVDTVISCPVRRETREWVRHAADLPRSTGLRR